MRLAVLIIASAAALTLAGCKKPAEDHAEPGDVVAAGSVSDPAAATVTMDQAAADAKAAAEAVQATEAQAETPVAAPAAGATAEAAPPTPPASPAH